MSHHERQFEEWQPGDEQLLSSLLAEAEERDPLPIDLVDLRATVHDHWQRSVGVEAAPRRTDRRRLLAVAATLLIGVLGLLVGLWSRTDRSRSTPVLATVWRSEGPVEISGARGDGGVRAGTVVETGAEGRIAFRLDGARSIRLDENSKIRFATGRHVEWISGRVYSDSGSATAGGEAIVVDTPLGEVLEIGTQYEVSSQGEDVLVRVREGRVELSGGPADGVAAAAGEALTIRGDGTVTRSAIRSDGPAWRWATQLAPQMAIEGASLYELFAWTAREGGWRLRFENEAVRAEAVEIVLHGSIEGLGLLEGLELAMAGSGLAAAVESSDVGSAELRVRRIDS